VIVVGSRRAETLGESVNVGQSGVHEIVGSFIASGGPFVRGCDADPKADQRM
jgi:hypothetical protein